VDGVVVVVLMMMGVLLDFFDILTNSLRFVSISTWFALISCAGLTVLMMATVKLGKDQMDAGRWTIRMLLCSEGWIELASRIELWG
jgi:hypothetical protein